MSLLRRLYEHVTPVRDAQGVRRSFRLPAEGFLFMAVTTLIGLAAMNTSTQLLFLVFAMLLSFWVMSAVMASVSLWGVDVTREAPRLAQAGRPVRVTLRASNSKRRFASLSLRASDMLADGQPLGAAFFARVAPGADVEQSYECVFPRRGVARFEGVRVATHFPFSLIERTLSLPRPAEILVLAPLVDVGRELRPIQADMGEVESRRKGQGSALHALRPYAQGDTAREIHWKTTARTGDVMVRENESEERRRVSVVLDNRASSAEQATPQLLEHAIVLAGSLVAWAAEKGHEVQLLTASGRVGFGQGPPHVMRCRRALALLVPADPAQRGPDQHLEDSDSLHLVVAWKPGQQATGGDQVSVPVERHEEAIARALDWARAVEPAGPAPESLEEAQALGQVPGQS